MEQDTFQQEIGGDGEFLNADGVIDTLAPPIPKGAAVVTPKGGAPVAGMETAALSAPAANPSIASAVANNQAAQAKIGAWSTRNALSTGRLSAKIERLKSAIAQREMELAGMGGADVNSANPKVKLFSVGLARAKAHQAVLEAKLAKIQADKAKLDAMQAKQAAQSAKLSVMSSADGGTDEDADDYYNADGTAKKPFEIKVSSVLIGLALGLGIAYLISKSKTKIIA